MEFLLEASIIVLALALISLVVHAYANSKLFFGAGVTSAFAFLVFLGAFIAQKFMGDVRPIAVGDFMTFVAFATTAVCLVITLVQKAPFVLLTSSVFSIVTCSLAALVQSEVPSSVAESQLLTVHVLLFLASYVLLGVSLIFSGLYELHHKILKSKTRVGFLNYMPPMSMLDRVNRLLIIAGFALLTCGYLSGYLYARQAMQGSMWRIDPKIWLTTISWLIYLAAAYSSLRPKFHPLVVSTMSMVGFISLVLSFTANFIGFHRF